MVIRLIAMVVLNSLVPYILLINHTLSLLSCCDAVNEQGGAVNDDRGHLHTQYSSVHRLDLFTTTSGLSVSLIFHSLYLTDPLTVSWSLCRLFLFRLCCLTSSPRTTSRSRSQKETARLPSTEARCSSTSTGSSFFK